MKRLAAVCLLFVLGVRPAPARPQDRLPYLDRPQVAAFIRQMVAHHGFSKEQLQALFARARFVPAILDAIQPPLAARAPSWKDYRAQFVNRSHIDAGLAFWNAHLHWLKRAHRVYGVPPQVIVAIIGVESFYGRHTGRWRVIDALSTLAFDYPPRARFFRSELASFLLFTRTSGVDALTVRGSYAGAIGMPQFMPRSYRKYGVDFNDNGKINLIDSTADAIGSVANFLHAHGWRRGAPAALDATVRGQTYRAYVDGNVDLRYSLAQLARAGVAFRAPRVARGTRAALIELTTPGWPSTFRIGLHNFYVITRYNRSAFYAAAVSDLAQALRRARARLPRATYSRTSFDIPRRRRSARNRSSASSWIWRTRSRVNPSSSASASSVIASHPARP